MFAVADLPANMQNKITVDGDCWNWTGAKNPKGYGSVSNGRKGASALAHRKAYMHAVGSIPYGYEIDHLCENTSCVNPSHLEAVTPEEHRLRIGHKDLVPLYRVEPEPVHSPEIEAALGAFFERIAEYQRDYSEMTPEARGEDDARRHRLHVATNARCTCENEGALA